MPICRSHLIRNNLDDTAKLFCYCEAYQSRTETSGLLAPTTGFIAYISNLESMFVGSLQFIVHKVEIAKLLLASLLKFSCAECPHFPSNYLLKRFIRIRVYNALKFGNRDFKTSGSKKNRKYFKVKHL